MESVSFRPEIVQWWQALTAIPETLGSVHRWLAIECPPAHHDRGMHQHHTVTLVLCIAGSLRLTAHRRRIDLAAGDAVVIEAGAWHALAPQRPGSLLFAQGFMAGRSDWVISSATLELVSSIPAQPGLTTLASVCHHARASERRILLCHHLRTVVTERSQPLTAPHPNYLAMELGLWDHLHRPDALLAMVHASGLSRAQAYRVFTSCAGQSPATWLRNERVTLAKRLLADGVAHDTVAERCGFAHRRALMRVLAEG